MAGPSYVQEFDPAKEEASAKAHQSTYSPDSDEDDPPALLKQNPKGKDGTDIVIIMATDRH